MMYSLIVLIVVSVAMGHGAPDPLDDLWDTSSVLLYKQLKLAQEVDTANNTKQLLLELKSLAQQTVQNFGCKFDPKSQDFTNRFLKGFGKVVAHIDSSEKLWRTARKIAVDVVNSYGCNGMVSTGSTDFDNKFKAAYAVVILGQAKPGGDPRLGDLARAIVTQAYPKCKLPGGKKAFNEFFLSSFTETVMEKTDDETGLDLSRIQGAKLIQKLGCGQVDAQSEKFRTTVYVAYAGIILKS